jgi:DUF1009 family protein
MSRAAEAPLGLIAGGGLMPQRVADAAVKANRGLLVIAIEGFADPADYAQCPDVQVVPLGQVARMLALLRQRGVGDLVLAGRVKRPSLLSFRFDVESAKLVGRLGKRALFGGDDGLLSAVLAELRASGFNPIGAQDVLADLMVEAGQLGRHAPDAVAEADIVRGIAVAQALGNADVGQSCAVQQGLVLALEAIEGTDGMLDRIGALRREGPGGVLVKLVKPRQDLRADLPVIGPDTVLRAAAAGLRGIAIEARLGSAGTLVLERAETIAVADREGLFLVAIRPERFTEQERPT